MAAYSVIAPRFFMLSMLQEEGKILFIQDLVNILFYFSYSELMLRIVLITLETSSIWRVAVRTNLSARRKQIRD